MTEPPSATAGLKAPPLMRPTAVAPVKTVKPSRRDALGARRDP
jgi:hypothetical protein